MVSDMFMTDKEKEICKALDGLIAPCDAELNVSGGGYTLKTNNIEDLATATMFFRDAVVDNGIKEFNHFIDGGMSKDPIKIPDIKFGMFVSKLKQNARNRTGMYRNVQVDWRDKITYGKHITQCNISINAALVGVGIAIKHKNDVENEYIGKSLSFNRAFDKLEKAVLGIEDEKVVGTALSMAFEDNYVNVGRSGSITRCITGADVDRGDAVYVGHGGRVYPANSKQKSYRGGRVEDSKIKPETKSESMPDLMPIHDDITITMSREQAEDVLETLRNNPGNIFTYLDLHEKICV